VTHATIRFYEEMRRHYYTTPSSYLELIKLYKTMLEKKKDKLDNKKDKISNGLQVILEL
jgi:dynein heavy chain